MGNTVIRLIIFFATKDGEALIQSAKTRPGADCGSDHELLIAKFKLKLKRVEYITQKVGLEESQSGIKIARRNINNLRYADDTTLMAESEDELKKLLMRVKEQSTKNDLKFNIKKLRSWPLVPSPPGKFESMQNASR